MTQVDIKIINNKRICLRNSFCVYNLTDKCNNCSVKFGNIKKKSLFKSVNSITINLVIDRIYN
jgi:hypothetical protein